MIEAVSGCWTDFTKLRCPKPGVAACESRADVFRKALRTGSIVKNQNVPSDMNSQTSEIRMRDVGERAKLPLETVDVRSFGASECYQRQDLVGFTIVSLVRLIPPEPGRRRIRKRSVPKKSLVVAVINIRRTLVVVELRIVNS